MIKIEITVPLFYNDKTPIEDIKFDKIERDLLKQFGGLTISAENKGMWMDGKTVYLDTNKIYTIISETYNIAETESFLKSYQKWLEHDLEQEKIFIVISDVKTI